MFGMQSFIQSKCWLHFVKYPESWQEFVFEANHKILYVFHGIPWYFMVFHLSTFLKKKRVEIEIFSQEREKLFWNKS